MDESFIDEENGRRSNMSSQPDSVDSGAESPASGPAEAPCAGSPGRFATTHWSLVVAAADTHSPKAREALGNLFRAYWYPLYAYVRRKGHSAEDSLDLTQEFFTRILSRNYLNVADRQRGKFRSFLLGSLEHFLAREWTKARAQKRGGGRQAFSLDAADAEDRYHREPAHDLTAERIYERRWAIAILDQAMDRLRDECSASGKGELFERVKGQLSGEKGEDSYADVAAALEMSEGAVKVAVHRLRRRFGEVIRAEIERTVATPEDVEEELLHLFHALRE